MKNLLLILCVFITACHKGDHDLKTGTYKLYSPMSINGVLLDSDYWIITKDSLTVTHYGQVTYKGVIHWNGNKCSLWENTISPYYEESMAGGKIVTVWYGFFYYPPSGQRFTLNREY